MGLLEGIDLWQLLTPAGFVAFLLHDRYYDRSYYRKLIDQLINERNIVQAKRIEDQQNHNRDLMEAVRKLDEVARAYRGAA